MLHFNIVALQIISLILLAAQCTGQVLSLGTGQMFYNSKTIVPVVNQFESRSNDEYHSLNLTIIEIDRYMIGTAFSTYQGWVDFNANAETWRGFGSSRKRLWRLSPYLGYIISPDRKFRFIPYIKVIIEKSVITGLNSSKSQVAEIDEPFGYQGSIFVEPIKRIQLAPGAGLLLHWNTFGRLYLIGNIYYTYGYRPFQKYYFEYSYQGVEQPTAEWHANGTGVFTSIGIGYKLWNTDQDSKDRK